jgi:hypothetical protein
MLVEDRVVAGYLYFPMKKLPQKEFVQVLLPPLIQPSQTLCINHNMTLLWTTQQSTKNNSVSPAVEHYWYNIIELMMHERRGFMTTNTSVLAIAFELWQSWLRECVWDTIFVWRWPENVSNDWRPSGRKIFIATFIDIGTAFMKFYLTDSLRNWRPFQLSRIDF